MTDFPNLHLVEHPLLEHKLTVLRDKRTNAADFRRVMKEMSQMVGMEATRDLSMRDVEIETPLETMMARKVGEEPALISIMRAGNGMLEGMMSLMPFANAGHIGIYRDKFLNTTVEYYFRLPPKIEGKRIWLLEPLVASGNTAIACISRLKQCRVGEIRMLSLLVVREGLEKIFGLHPDVKIYAVAMERGLNEMGYLLPGIGDAGDRLYQPIEK